MKVFANLLVVLGVCLGALGAAGLHRPYGAGEDVTREPYAGATLAVGLTALLAGGLLVRHLRRSSAGSAAAAATHAQALALLTTIRDRVRALDDARATLDGDQAHDAIGALLAEEYFDLTSRSDELALQLGFGTYARVWEGVATAERLLARCWSMCSDGFAEEGLEELPHARASLEQAHEALRTA